ERLAIAAYLTGRDDECADLLDRAHHGFLDGREVTRAVRCAFWMGFMLLTRGEMARAGGWLARAERLLEEAQEDCVERGYLLLPLAFQNVFAGDFQAVYDTFAEALEIGERFDDLDLVTMARHGQGRALMRLGQTADGLALLDEAMVAVTAGEVSPIIAGHVYCSVIEACQEIFDLRRAQEWTEALGRWCESQPDLVPYRGQCLVHRSQIMQIRGAWSEALEEARRACDRLAEPNVHPAVGMAFYQRAELHRLRGELSEAEEAYREASRWGHDPQPGLALLRLAQGRLDNAVAAIRRVVSEARDAVSRSKVLPAYVEVMLEAGDVSA
ncbi:MAG: DNA-binding response regulator, partial [Actinomycetota bacterium]|nr:DNA-binding response regulator [Actinomycetota bacterium]